MLCYQIRQSFKPGEITPEEANRIGYETAMRWAKGKYAFFVATHTDRQHIHNHIYYNSTSLDCTRKYRDFLGSARRLRRLSDRVCLENDLSVIAHPKLHNQGHFLDYGQWLGADRPPSLQARLRAAIAEALRKGPADFAAFLALMEEDGYTVKHGRGGKGPGYERWAKVYNLKQMAAALQFLQEHKLTDYDALAVWTDAAVSRFHKLTEELKSTEAALSKTSELMGAVVDYAKTRPVFDGYKAARYSKKYLAEHEAELATYRAARTTINELLNGEKLPKMDALKASLRELSEKKKALYAEHRAAQAEMREAVAVKANIDHLLGHADGRENKKQTR